MALTTTEFADAMKTFYLGPLNDQVYRATALLNRLEKNSEDVAGNFAYVPLITARNPGVGSRKDTATSGPLLPDHGRQTYDTATFKMALHYGRGSISGPVMRASKSSSGAFAKALDTEMRGLMKRLPEDLNRQAHSYGHGRAATVSATFTSSTLVEVYSKSIMGLRIGDRVHVADISDGTIVGPANGTTVANIERDTDVAGAASTTKHRITLTAAASGTITDDTLYFGARTSMTTEDSSRSQEMYGIAAIVDDGAIGADEDVAALAGEFLDGSLNIGSIDRTAAASAIIRSKVLANSGTLRPLTVSLMEEAFLYATDVGGATDSDIEMWTSPGLWATFGLLHVGDRRYNDYKKTLEGGFTALMFDDRPLFKDRDCIRHVIWFLDMSAIFLLTQSGYELMDEDGKTLQRITDRDAYEFTLYRDVQMGARRFNTHVKLADLEMNLKVEADV